MKKLLLLSLAAILLAGAQLNARTFIDEYVIIYEKATGEKPEVSRVSGQEMRDSLKTVIKAGTADLDTPKYLDSIKYVSRMSLCISEALPDAAENSNFQKLLAGYEELGMFRFGAEGTAVLGKMRKDKVTEMVMMIDYRVTPPKGPENIPDFFSWNVVFIMDVEFTKPLTLDQVANALGSFKNDEKGDGNKEGLELQNLLGFDPKAGINTTIDASFTVGEWPDENIPAKNWVIKEEGGKFGLFDAGGNTVIPADYDGIKHFTGFLYKEDNVSSMYILGFELTREGKKGYADLEGKIIIPTRYDKLQHFQHGRSRLSRVFIGDHQGLISEITGELVIPIEYISIDRMGHWVELVTETGDVYKIDWNKDKEELEGEISLAGKITFERL